MVLARRLSVAPATGIAMGAMTAAPAVFIITGTAVGARDGPARHPSVALLGG